MQPTNTPALPQMNLGEALGPSWAGFNNTDLDHKFPQSPVDSPVGEKSNESHGVHGVNDDDDSPSDGSNLFNQMTNSQVGKSRGSNQHKQSTDVRGENSKESGKKPTGFFDLPYDTRRIIYRHLLRANGPIRSVPHRPMPNMYIPDTRPRDIHPQILSTCRQINSECRDMLFGENTFSVSVWEFYHEFGPEQACNPYRSLYRRPTPLIFQRMKQLEVRVEECYPKDPFVAVRTTGRVLSQLPQLKYVSIQVHVDVHINPHFSKLDLKLSPLQGFEMVRNVPRVTVEGVSSDWKQHLIEKMTSSSQIPRMYYALEAYAGSIECARIALRRAYSKAGADHLEGFLEARREVIDAVNSHMSHAANHLFDYDSSEEQSRPNCYRPIAEQSQKCTPSSGCQHC